MTRPRIGGLLVVAAGLAGCMAAPQPVTRRMELIKPPVDDPDAPQARPPADPFREPPMRDLNRYFPGLRRGPAYAPDPGLESVPRRFAEPPADAAEVETSPPAEESLSSRPAPAARPRTVASAASQRLGRPLALDRPRAFESEVDRASAELVEDAGRMPRLPEAIVVEVDPSWVDRAPVARGRESSGLISAQPEVPAGAIHLGSAVGPEPGLAPGSEANLPAADLPAPAADLPPPARREPPHVPPDPFAEWTGSTPPVSASAAGLSPDNGPLGGLPDQAVGGESPVFEPSGAVMAGRPVGDVPSGAGLVIEPDEVSRQAGEQEQIAEGESVLIAEPPLAGTLAGSGPPAAAEARLVAEERSADPSVHEVATTAPQPSAVQEPTGVMLPGATHEGGFALVVTGSVPDPPGAERPAMDGAEPADALSADRADPIVSMPAPPELAPLETAEPPTLAVAVPVSPGPVNSASIPPAQVQALDEGQGMLVMEELEGLAGVGSSGWMGDQAKGLSVERPVEEGKAVEAGSGRQRKRWGLPALALPRLPRRVGGDRSWWDGVHASAPPPQFPPTYYAVRPGPGTLVAPPDAAVRASAVVGSEAEPARGLAGAGRPVPTVGPTRVLEDAHRGLQGPEPAAAPPRPAERGPWWRLRLGGGLNRKARPEAASGVVAASAER